MRSFVTSVFALAVALAPAAAAAQGTTGSTTTQPPAGQPPAGQPPAAAAPAAPAGPKLGFKTPAGLLLVQVKADQTAVFEEMMSKIQTGVATSSDPDTKSQTGTWKYYKAAEPAAGGNIMYIVIIEPAKPNVEYQFLEVLNKTLTDEQKRDPATQEMYKKYAGAIAAMNMLNVTPGGGGQ
jgi:hypothetical protein